MTNEITRKLTSLTLMTIMVAGGMTIAAPGFTPDAHAQSRNANLFVSAENAQFENYFGGPQVIEVVIRDADISDTDSGTGEPDVTINGADLRMIQGTDGLWYAYFADLNQAQIADATVGDNAGQGLDFGTISTGNAVNAAFSDADGIAQGNYLNVVREAKQENSNNNADRLNNTGVAWPFIQLHEFDPTGNVVIQYNKGGGAQSVTLTFDTIGGHGVEFDRTVYPQGAQVHATIMDAWLNIDPTDEDSWTFATGDTLSTYYQLVDEDGKMKDKGNSKSPDLTDYLGDLMCDETCQISIDPDAQGTGDVLEFQGNNNTTDIPQTAITDLNKVTITEQGPNSAMFGTYDESDISTIKITDEAKRNTTATFDYNDSTVSILVGHVFATIDIQPVDDAWNSGETIPVVITDADANKNSRVDEDLIVSDPGSALIPALETGDPFTLNEGTPTVYFAQVNSNTGIEQPNSKVNADIMVEKFSDRGIITPDDIPTGTGTPTTTERTENGLTEAQCTAKNDAANISNAQLTITAFDAAKNDNYSKLPSGLAVAIGLIGQGDYDALPQSIKDIYDPQIEDSYAADTVCTYTVTTTTGGSTGPVNALIINFGTDMADLLSTILYDDFKGYNFYHQDISSIGDGPYNVFLGDTQIAENIDAQSGLTELSNSIAENTGDVILTIVNTDGNFELGEKMPIVTDFFSFGFTGDGESGSDRVANQIVRIEVEESGDNTSTFEGELEYIMVNQLNILDKDTYTGLSPIASDPTFIAIEDLTDEDSIRVNYLDLGADGVSTQIADQEEAPSHSGIVSLDGENYKVADTVTITLEDADLNVDSDLIDIYTISTLPDTVGEKIMFGGADIVLGDGNNLGRVLDVTFDDTTWTAGCGSDDNGLDGTGFTLVETGTDTGVFMGDFQIPEKWCNNGELESTTGLDIEVNYMDFRDASGEIIEVGDSAGVGANTGSVSFDRSVYPVPFASDTFEMKNGDYLKQGDLSVHVRVNDPDFDVSASGEDTISMKGDGPVKISVTRGSETMVLGYAGGTADPPSEGKQYGAIEEIAPDAGIFEADIPVTYMDGPKANKCPADSDTCILQGDIIEVEYTDPTDASGAENSVTDSATFDLRNGVLQSDKSVYIIGSDIILTLIEPDFDLDNDQAETYDLNLIEWDSDAFTGAMGTRAEFDPEPSDLRETGDSTGIFQIVIETPGEIDGDRLERGEEIELEYTDWGPAGSDYVGDEEEDVNLTIFTSNFGATIELDQKVYTWTDKVYITIVAPDHNFDSDLVDEIGDTEDDPVKVSTRGDDLDNYKLVETGTDTGIFTGEVILTGFDHNADGDTTTGTPTTGYDNDQNNKSADDRGPTNGYLMADDDDGITVSFEFSEDETVVASALIRWNIGEVQWLEASYPATGTGVVRVIDPDMNWNPENVDNFEVDLWSDSDSGGIDLTVTETNEATGIFEGTVFFTITDESSGHRLRVAEGDTITAEYADNTLPDPYTTADELDVSATSLIGTVVPPLSRAQVSDLRVVDSFENSIDAVSVDQQVQITADVMSGQDKDQDFAYLVQVQNSDGVTVSLSWITGTLLGGQSLSPAQSWTPDMAGTYTATVFIWESIDNPTALSPQSEINITVS